MRTSKKQTAVVVLAVGAFSSATAGVWGSIPGIGLYSTGVDNNGTAIGYGVADPHWFMSSGPAAVTVNAAFPLNGFPGGVWASNSNGTNGYKWISDRADTGSAGSAVGNFTFTETFGIPASADLASIVYYLNVLADNSATIYVNGANVGTATSYSSPTVVTNSYVGLHYGSNTLQVVVNNGGTGPNPMGLRVAIDGSYAARDASAHYWTATGGGQFTVATCWVDGAVPTSGAMIFANATAGTAVSFPFAWPTTGTLQVNTDNVSLATTSGTSFGALVMSPNNGDKSVLNLNGSGSLPLGSIQMGSSLNPAATSNLTIGSSVSASAPNGTSLYVNSVLNVNGSLTTGNLYMAADSQLNLVTGGRLTVSGGTSSGFFNWTGGTLGFSGNDSLDVNSLTTNSLTLPSAKALSVAGTLTVPSGSTLTVSGGTVTLGGLSQAGTINFNSGTVNFTGNVTLPPSLTSITSGKSLTVAGTATLAGSTTLTSNYGILSVGAIAGTGTLNFMGGVNAAGQFVSNLPTATLGALALSTSAMVPAGATVSVSGSTTFNNNGQLAVTGGMLTLGSTITGTTFTTLGVGTGKLVLTGSPMMLNTSNTLSYPNLLQTGATMVVQGTATFGSQYFLTVSGGTASFAGLTGPGTLYYTNGSLTLPASWSLGYFQTSSPYPVPAGQMVNATLVEDRGGMTLSGGTVTATNVTGTGSFTFSSGTFNYNNNAIAGTFPLATVPLVPAAGTLAVSGTLTVPNTSTVSGKLTTGGAVSVTAGGSLNVAGTVIASGPFYLANGGSATISGGTVTATGVTSTGTGALSLTGQLNLTGSGTVLTIGTSGPMGSTVTFTSSRQVSAPSGTVAVDPTGNLQIAGPNPYIAAISNAGVFTLSGGSFYGTLANSGSAYLTGGTFSGVITGSGYVAVGGGALTIQQPASITANTVDFTGYQTANLSVTANVMNMPAGGVLYGGTQVIGTLSASDTLTLAGTSLLFHQASISSLQIQGGYSAPAGSVASVGSANISSGTLTIPLGANWNVGSITSFGTVSVSGTLTVGSMNGGTGSFKLGSNGTIAYTGSNDLNLSVLGKSVSIANGACLSAPNAVVALSNSMTASLGTGGSLTAGGLSITSGSTFSLLGGILPSLHSLTVFSGTASFAGSQTSLQLGNVVMTNGGGVITVSDVADRVVDATSLAIYSGSMELGKNDMIVRNGDAISVGSLIGSGMLKSSSASPTSGTYTTLGVILDNDGAGKAMYSTFDGVAVTASDVLVMYTYVGDTDLNGRVDANDLANLLAGMGGGLTGWANGDVNYDGVVNAADLSMLLNGLQHQGAPLGGGTGGNGGAVPEPSASLATLPAMALLGRARRGRPSARSVRAGLTS